MKSKYLMFGAAACAALLFFSGFMLYRQYADEKQSAEAFRNISALVQPETTPADDPQESEAEIPPKPLLINMRRFMSGTTILQAGFLLTAQTLIIPLCRASTIRITT